MLKFVAIVIAVIIVLPLLLGVAIPRVVWGLFGKVLLVVGFFTFLGSFGRSRFGSG